MTGWVQSLLGYLSLHPTYAGAVVFLVAMGEALFVIGLFFPSTVVLVGAGTLVGLGKLPFWPVFLLTVLGAVAGDAVSYWFGHIYKDHIKAIWPFSRFPNAIAKGEAFMQRHGGKSVFIGRFVPGVKAVIPGIAGMTGMDAWRFTVINIVSAFAWAAAHLFPAIFAGAALSLLGAMSTRLLIAASLILASLLVSIWGARWLAIWFTPLLASARQSLIVLASRRVGRPWAWISTTFDPSHPRATAMAVAAFVFVLAIPSFVFLLGEIGPGEALVRSDAAISNLMGTLRTVATDHVMVFITMLGDTRVTLPVAVAVLLWLAWRRAWLPLAGLAAAVSAAVAFVPLMKLAVHRLRPIELYAGADGFSFPSGHATINAVFYAIVAYLIAHGLARWAQAATYAAFGGMVLLIGLSRIYLGAHWPSDVAAGLLFGAAVASSFALFIGGQPKAASSRGLIAVVFGTLILASSVHFARGYSEQVLNYAPRETVEVLDFAAWRIGQWRVFPARRIDLVGETEEPITIQWSGTAKAVEAELTGDGWRAAHPFSLRSLANMLSPNLDLSQLPLFPTLHDGILPALTMTKPDADGGSGRLVLRLWPTSSRLSTSSADARILIGSVVQERAQRWFGMGTILRADDDYVPGEDILRPLSQSSSIALRADSAGDAKSGIPTLLAESD